MINVNPIFPQNHVSFLGVSDPDGPPAGWPPPSSGSASCLTLLFRFTRFGLATRASAETEVGALVSGLSPDRIALTNWIISFVVSGIAGVLIAPLVPLEPGTYTLFIVPALAAAVVGRFHSLGWAITAGLGIGALESLSVYVNGIHPDFPAGAGELIPLVLVLVVLAVRGQTMPSRGTLLQVDAGAGAAAALAHPDGGRRLRGMGWRRIYLFSGNDRAGALHQLHHRGDHAVTGGGDGVHGADLAGAAHVRRRLGLHPEHVRQLVGHPVPDRAAAGVAGGRRRWAW